MTCIFPANKVQCNNTSCCDRHQAECCVACLIFDTCGDVCKYLSIKRKENNPDGKNKNAPNPLARERGCRGFRHEDGLILPQKPRKGKVMKT